MTMMLTFTLPVMTFVICSPHLQIFFNSQYCKQSDQDLIVCFHEIFLSEVHLNICSRCKKQMKLSGHKYQGLPWLRICCSQHFSQMEKVIAK